MDRKDANIKLLSIQVIIVLFGLYQYQYPLSAGLNSFFIFLFAFWGLVIIGFQFLIQDTSKAVFAPYEYTDKHNNKKIPLDKAVYYCYKDLFFFGEEHLQYHNIKPCYALLIREGKVKEVPSKDKSEVVPPSDPMPPIPSNEPLVKTG